jgi:hypothetical protein
MNVKRTLPSFLALLLIAGCTSEATQLIVVVDSDLAVPSQITRVEVRIFDKVGLGNQSVANSLWELGTGKTEIPFSFGIAPSGDPEGALVIAAFAFGPQGRLFESRAITGFVAGQTRAIYLPLLGSCINLRCTMPDTCRNGTCGSDQYDPSSLARVEPGHELDGYRRPPPFTGGTGQDAGALDSGPEVDSGLPPLDGGPLPDGALVPDSGLPPPPTPCTDTSQCGGQCPEGSQGCECLMTMEGMGCIPICSAANTTCPTGLVCVQDNSCRPQR